MIIGIFGLVLSSTIIVLVSLMAVAFFKYSAEELTAEIRTLSISFYSSQIYACIVFCFSRYLYISNGIFALNPLRYWYLYLNIVSGKFQ